MSNATLTTEQEFIELLLLVPAAERATVLIELEGMRQAKRKHLAG